MKTSIFSVTLVLSAGILATAQPTLAAQFKVNANGMTVQMSPKANTARHLSCKVWGTPVEFPDQVLLTNDGNIAIPAGTKVHWQTRDHARSGNFTLPKTLAVGKSAYAPEPGGYARGAPCDVSFVTGPLNRRPTSNMTVDTTHPVLKLAPLHAKCYAAGPAEFPDRVVFLNDGPRTIPAGTHIRWAFNAQVKGLFTVPKALPHNQRVGTHLSPSPGGHATCTAKLVK